MTRLLQPDRLARVLSQATGDDEWRSFSAELIAGGKSNLTFALASNAGHLVLRRPPEGDLLPSAHDMEREVRVQRALVGTKVPVARILFADLGGETLGVPFYVMERVDGHVIRDSVPAGYADGADDRHKMADALVDVLAELHTIEPSRVGLEKFGRADRFLARQVRRWTAQSEKTRRIDQPELDALAAALAAGLPESSTAAIVHGDYRLDNCLMHPHDPGRVAAVLDWELSTLGDPLADLGLLLFYWPHRGEAQIPLVPTVSSQNGFPPRSYLLDRYAAATGADVSAVPFYEAFARFKFAVIIQGVTARSEAGTMGGQHFGNFDADVVRLAKEGLTKLEELR
ncbi:phosphotransferase family protein [Hoyosella sp. YIM 151337]|uniref:phosphotransferase family protein n=1 Tax=Hoyosella sp. YIM 151337 TaxID=2992742 RepID=UPI002235ACF8|nr:phosphotransferase family protein [Hoyosella sp. YIM 151337]MCW4354536.1 phosphotransferase family protein [Hoyosella sp. YIM 151337]